MNIVRFTPLGEMAHLQERMNRLFDDMVPAGGKREDFLTGAWVPKVDIYETEGEVVLKADLPEISGKDVSIKVEDNVLTLSGERKMNKEVKEENYHRVERAYGTFMRSFTLPTNIAQDKIKASFKDGVLQISMPKREETKPRQVKIDVA